MAICFLFSVFFRQPLCTHKPNSLRFALLICNRAFEKDHYISNISVRIKNFHFLIKLILCHHLITYV